MPEWVTRITTSPGARSSTPSSSKRAAILPPSEWMRNALKRFMVSSPRCAVFRGAREPGDQPLSIECQVTGECVLELAVGQAAAVIPRQTAPQRQHVGADAGLRIGIAGVRARDAGELGDLRLERSSEARHIRHAAEVHQVDGLGVVGEHAIDGCNVLLGVELRRYRGRGDEGALAGVEGTIGDAEGVAAEDAGVRLIDDHVVMLGMTWRMNELETPAAERDAIAVGNHPDAR